MNQATREIIGLNEAAMVLGDWPISADQSELPVQIFDLKTQTELEIPSNDSILHIIPAEAGMTVREEDSHGILTEGTMTLLSNDIKGRQIYRYKNTLVYTFPETEDQHTALSITVPTDNEAKHLFGDLEDTHDTDLIVSPLCRTYGENVQTLLKAAQIGARLVAEIIEKEGLRGDNSDGIKEIIYTVVTGSLKPSNQYAIELDNYFGKITRPAKKEAVDFATLPGTEHRVKIGMKQKVNAERAEELLHDVGAMYNQVLGCASMTSFIVGGRDAGSVSAVRNLEQLLNHKDLTGLINEFTQFPRPYYPEEVDLAESLSSIVEWHQIAQSFGRSSLVIETDFKEIPKVKLDATQAKRAFRNLFSNASRIATRVKASARISADGQFVETVVSNNGRAIEKGKLESIFKRREQGDKSEVRGASGLGLAVVSKAAELNRGEVFAASQLEDGQFYRGNPDGTTSLIENPDFDTSYPVHFIMRHSISN